jgi:hypothetical protein
MTPDFVDERDLTVYDLTVYMAGRLASGTTAAHLSVKEPL